MIPKLNARMGLSGCRKIGYIRILVAAIHIFDRLLLGMDLGLFLSPKDGLLPIDSQEHGFFGLNSLGRHAEDDTYLWLLYSIGLLNAVLILLGIAPRLNAISFYFNTCSLHNMNWMLCDGVYTGVCPLVRIFSFIFVFLPLHHITVWDKFGRNLKYHKDEDCSWVMWPVWLLQWQSVFVMLGAMVGKLDGDFWMNGTAMYYVSSCTDEGAGIFNPDILFNTVITSKFLTWSALAVEIITPFTVWFEKTRFPTLMILLQIFAGMDLSMNMGTFEWYNILGWAFFLIRSEEYEKAVLKKEVKASNIHKSFPRKLLRLVGYVWFLIHFVSLVSFAFPFDAMYSISPPPLREYLHPVTEFRDRLNEEIAPFFELKLDLFQGEWCLFNGSYNGATPKIALEATMVDGKVRQWRTIDWNKIPKWKRKRYYNFLNYLKHISDASEDPEEELSIFLEYVTENILFPSGMDMQSLSLWTFKEKPLPYPENLGWFDELRKDNLIIRRLKERLYYEFTDDHRKELLARDLQKQTEWFYDLFEEVSEGTFDEPHFARGEDDDETDKDDDEEEDYEEDDGEEEEEEDDDETDKDDDEEEDYNEDDGEEDYEEDNYDEEESDDNEAITYDLEEHTDEMEDTYYEDDDNEDDTVDSISDENTRAQNSIASEL